MNITLPQPITTYIEATNARNTDALLTTFAADAYVRDEGQEYHGTEEIRQWKTMSEEKYQFTLKVIDAVKEGNENVVTMQVSGNFDGSPIQLHFQFTLKGNKIAALSIHD